MLAHGCCRCWGGLFQCPERRIVYRRHPSHPSHLPARCVPCRRRSLSTPGGCGSIADRAIPRPQVATLEWVRA